MIRPNLLRLYCLKALCHSLKWSPLSSSESSGEGRPLLRYGFYSSKSIIKPLILLADAVPLLASDTAPCGWWEALLCLAIFDTFVGINVSQSWRREGGFCQALKDVTGYL